MSPSFPSARSLHTETRAGVILDPVRAVATLTVNRALNVFGDHSYRMDLRGSPPFSAIGLDHGHIYGMCNGLLEAGGQLRSVYDPDPAKVAEFRRRYPGTEAAPSEVAGLADERG